MLLVSQVMKVKSYREEKFPGSKRELHYLSVIDDNEYSFLVDRRVKIPDLKRGDYVQIVFDSYLKSGRPFNVILSVKSVRKVGYHSLMVDKLLGL